MNIYANFIANLYIKYCQIQSYNNHNQYIVVIMIVITLNYGKSQLQKLKKI